MLSHFSCVRLFLTLWTVGHQSSLSVGVLQIRILECVAILSPGDPSDPGIEPKSPALKVDSLRLSHRGSPRTIINH